MEKAKLLHQTMPLAGHTRAMVVVMGVVAALEMFAGVQFMAVAAALAGIQVMAETVETLEGLGTMGQMALAAEVAADMDNRRILPEPQLAGAEFVFWVKVQMALAALLALCVGKEDQGAQMARLLAEGLTAVEVALMFWVVAQSA